MSDKKILIVGAGPGGLTSAMILAHRGLDVTVLEKENIVGMSWCDNFLPEHFREQVEEQIKYLLSNNKAKIEYHENPILNSAGEERWIAWNTSLLRY